MTNRPFISFMTDFGVGSSAPSVYTPSAFQSMYPFAPDNRAASI